MSSGRCMFSSTAQPRNTVLDSSSGRSGQNSSLSPSDSQVPSLVPLKGQQFYAKTETDTTLINPFPLPVIDKSNDLVPLRQKNNTFAEIMVVYKIPSSHV